MSLFYNEQQSEPKVGNIVIAIVLSIVAFMVLWMSVMPNYRIYKQRKSGEAALRQQEWEKKILIEQANAQNQAANLDAEARLKRATAESEAEIIRAKGAAEANRIIGESLTGNEAYLRYLWIDKISGGNQVIYVPTEAGLPILEAGKR